MTTAVLEDKTAIIEQANALTVKTASDRQMAADLWDSLRAFRKKAEAQKENVCRPLKTAWDQAKVPFDDFVKECQGHETRLQGLMSAYDREMDRLARIEQDRLQAIVDKQNAKIEAKAEAKGIEPVLKVAPVVQAPARVLETQAGTKQQRTEKVVYGIKDCLDVGVNADNPKVAKLLAAYPFLFELNWVAFRKLASTGMLDSISCVEQRKDYVYSQRS